MPEIKRVKKSFEAGRKIALSPQKYFELSCWEAAKIALDKGMIQDNRNSLDSFLDGYNTFRER